MKSVQNNNKPIVKTKSIIFKIIISFIVLTMIYSIVLVISIVKLNEDKTIFDDIVSDTIPSIIDTNNYYSKIKELSYLIEKLNNAKTQSSRRIIHEESMNEITSIQEMSIKLKIKRVDLDKKLYFIRNELIQLNELVTKQLNIKNTIDENLQKVNQINYNMLLFVNKSNKLNDKDIQALKFYFQDIISLTYKAIRLNKLNQLRQTSKKIKALKIDFKTIEPLKEFIYNIDKIIIEKNGIIDLKIQHVRINGQVQGNANFVNTLIKDFATNIEYETFKSIQNLTSKAQLNSDKVQKQTNYIYIIYILGFLLLLIIILYINKIIVSRLINLNYNINTKLIGKRTILRDNYNDEISQIIETFNFYSEKVEEQNRELEKLSVTDKLTGIYNRRKLDTIIEDEIKRTKRFNHSFSVTILDIDYFKKVNDTYGHTIGDSFLKEIATLLEENIRQSDFIGRWGGEEFVIVCPETNLEGTLKLIEHIRKTIEMHSFDVIGQKTASFGISIYSKEDTLKSLIKRADDALYNAKESGRNRIKYN